MCTMHRFFWVRVIQFTVEPSSSAARLWNGQPQTISSEMANIERKDSWSEMKLLCNLDWTGFSSPPEVDKDAGKKNCGQCRE